MMNALIVAAAEHHLSLVVCCQLRTRCHSVALQLRARVNMVEMYQTQGAVAQLSKISHPRWPDLRARSGLINRCKTIQQPNPKKKPKERAG